MPRTLLLLLFVFFLAWGTDDHIDLSQCGKTSNCFVRLSCIDGTSYDKLTEFTDVTKLKNGNCDAVIQMRFYTGKKSHITIQVNTTDSGKPIAKSGVTLEQGDQKFVCSENGPPVDNAQFKIVAKGKHIYESDIVFCSFIIEATIANLITNVFVGNVNFPKLQFTLDSSLVSIIYDTNEAELWKDSSSIARCDPGKITSLATSTGEFLQYEIDMYSFPPIWCEQPKSLMITRQTTTTVLSKGARLNCEKWSWKYGEKPTEIIIPKEEEFNVVCGERFCSLCPDLTPLTTPGCTPPQTSRDSDNCMIAVCPGTSNQWLIDDGRVLNGEMECKQETERPNSRKAAWYLNTSTAEVKVTKAACFEKTACLSNAQFGRTCPDNEAMECIELTNSDDKTKVFCDEGYQLSWSYAGGTPINTTNITCHFGTGKFRDDKSKEVPDAANVVCSKPRKKEKVAAASQSSLALPIGAGFGGLLLVALIAAIVVFVVRKMRQRQAKKPMDTVTACEPSAANKYVPSLENDAANKKGIALKDNRDPWLKRGYNRQIIEPSDEKALGRFDNGIFQAVILKEFARYSVLNRKTIFFNLTAFGTYGNNDDDDHKKDFGNFTQFWALFKACEQQNMDCLYTWEAIWRVVRIMHGLMWDAKFDNKENNLEDRMKLRMARFARPIFEALGWKIRPGEDPSDTNMRFFVVRVLFWARQGDVYDELERLAQLPIEQLESPLRAVVFQFIATYLQQAVKMKKLYWKHVLANPEDPEKDKFGTLRQHLLYGLTAAGGPFMKYEVFKEMYQKQRKTGKFFTPHDFHWAYKGATEDYWNMKDAIINFGIKTPADLDRIRNWQLIVKYELKTDAERDAIREEWRDVSVDTLNMMFECCYHWDDWGLIMDKAYKPYCNYVFGFEAPDDVIEEKHPAKQLKSRADNMTLLFDVDAKRNEKSKTDLLNDFVQSFNTIDPVAKKPGIVKIIKE